MAHKVHPISFRLKETKDWKSRWFDAKKYQQFLEEDYRIREFLDKKLKEASVQGIEIERFSGKIAVIITTARPGLIIGRGGSGIEEIKKAIQKFAKTSKDIRVEIREVKNSWEYASLVGASIVAQIEKRMPIRRIMKQSLSRMTETKGVQGARIEIAGRLGGAEIARREWLQLGRMPRQTLRADIDYALVVAKTRYGTIGVKVWVYKGEKFE